MVSLSIEDKEQYFVSVAKAKISQIPRAQDNDFAIMATRGEVAELRRIFTNMDGADKMSHIRSAIPFQPYHDDKANENYDHYITEAYQMIYDLGDNEAKEFIKESGVLSDRPIKTTGKM